MSQRLSTLEVLRRASARLAQARDVLDKFGGTPGSQRNALGIAVDRLRSIWHIVNLLDASSSAEREWFGLKSQEMASDDLIRFFRMVRDKDLKEGDDRIGGVRVSPRAGAVWQSGPSGITGTLRLPDGTLKHVHYPSPHGTESKITGDSHGGACFVVRLEDGSLVRQYVAIPPEMLDVSLTYKSPPITHLGKPLEEERAKELVEIYYKYMAQTIEELRAIIGPA